jgi:hypothetical protein
MVWVIQKSDIAPVHRVRAQNIELIIYEDFVKYQSTCVMDLNLTDKDKRWKNFKQYTMCESNGETKDKVLSTKNYLAIKEISNTCVKTFQFYIIIINFLKSRKYSKNEKMKIYASFTFLWVKF